MNLWSYLWETCFVSGMFVNWLKNFWDWGDRVFSHPISQTVDTQVKAQSRSPTPGPGALWGPSAGPSGDPCFTHSPALQPPPRNTAQKVGTCVGGWLLDAASCNVSYSWWSDYTRSRLIWPGRSLAQSDFPKKGSKEWGRAWIIIMPPGSAVRGVPGESGMKKLGGFKGTFSEQIFLTCF